MRRNVITPALAILITTGFFAVLAFLAIHGVPDGDSANVVMTLVGALAAQFANVLGYYFGSSKSSGDKTDALHASLDRAISKDP